MKRIVVLLVSLMGLVILVLFGLQAYRANGQQSSNSLAPGLPGEQPTVVPAQDLTPAPPPPDKRQVAILTLVVSSNAAGEVESVKLQQGRIIHSFAPNVLHLAGGEWTVELSTQDQKTIHYGIVDPRRVESFDPQTNQYSTFLQPNMTWNLIVPLYDDETNLNVVQITLYDQNGKPIFSTPVDYQGWSQQ